MDSARYAELFLTESREHVSAINHALLELERSAAAGGVAETQKTAIGSLFRAVHTIKGMSATMGYTAIATLSHEMEALLDCLRRGETVADTPLMDTLFKAADALESAIERAVAGKPADARIERIAARLREATASSAATANDAASDVTPRRGGANAPRPSGRRRKTPLRPRPRARAARNTPAATERPGAVLRIRFVDGAPLRGARAAVAVQRARVLGEVTSVEPAETTFSAVDFGQDVTIRILSALPSAEIVRSLETVGDVASIEVVAAVARRKCRRR